MNAVAQNADEKGDPNALITLTILYDNTASDESLQAEWGFACLIEGTEKTILFDTGGKPEVLAANCQKLKMEPNNIDLVVISHMHWDHINGLEWLMNENPAMKIYLPHSATEETVRDLKGKADSVERITDMRCLCGGVFSTGTLEHKIPEQALCLETPEGLAVITGCSHPGIVWILQRAKAISNQKLHLVFGGFHLKDHAPEQIDAILKEMKKMGIEKIGPTHCTGAAAITAFRSAWGSDCLSLGVGKQIRVRTKSQLCTEGV